MTRIFIVLTLTFIVITQTFGQKTYTSYHDVFKTTEITFYGYDFSKLKLIETKRMGEDMTQQIFGWVAFCQERFTDEKLKDWFRKEKVTSNLSPTIERAKKVNGKEVVTYTKNTIHPDSVQAFINAYNITEKEGIGLAVILECFEKDSKTTSGYFTFFDIASKKILLSDYFSGKEADGYGLTNYWGVSLVGTTSNYASLFRKRLKQMGLTK
jgi:hypothetical protein